MPRLPSYAARAGNLRLVGLGHPDEGFDAVVYQARDTGLIHCDAVAYLPGGHVVAVTNTPSTTPLTQAIGSGIPEFIHAPAASFCLVLQSRWLDDDHKREIVRVLIGEGSQLDRLGPEP